MPARQRPAIVINAVVAALCTALAVATLFPLFHLENGGHGARVFVYLPAWLLLALAVNRIFAGLQAMLTGSWPKRFVRVAKYTLWLVIPPLILIHIEKAVVAEYTALVKRDSAPAVAAIHRALAHTAERIQEELDGRPVPHWIKIVTVSPASANFMLTTRFPSIDIDGFTMWYESETARWYRFHNDDPAADEWRARSERMIELRPVVYCERKNDDKLACAEITSDPGTSFNPEDQHCEGRRIPAASVLCLDTVGLAATG